MTQSSPRSLRLTRRQELANSGAKLTPLLAAATAPSSTWAQHASHEARAAAFPGFQMVNIAIRKANIDRLKAFIAGQPELVVDLSAVFGDPATTLPGPDGAHALLEGQAAIARPVLERLTA